MQALGVTRHQVGNVRFNFRPVLVPYVQLTLLVVSFKSLISFAVQRCDMNRHLAASICDWSASC
jgi:hypothetical protein